MRALPLHIQSYAKTANNEADKQYSTTQKAYKQDENNNEKPLQQF